MAGDNLITVINLCATYDGYSCAFGGYSPPEKSNPESASQKIMRIIDEVGFDDSTFLFNNSRSFNCNIRPVCLLTPPPLGKYANCPAVTDLEGEVCATLHNIALLAFASAGINCLLLSFAGKSCGIIKKVLNDIRVNDTTPFSGRFVKCDSTTHLSTFVTLKSSSVKKQVDNAVKVSRDISDALRSFCDDCVDNQMSFLDRVLKHPDLPFATDDEENIDNLKKEFASIKSKTVSAETCAKMSKSKTGHSVSAETRAKMSKSRTGKTVSAETVQK